MLLKGKNSGKVVWNTIKLAWTVAIVLNFHLQTTFFLYNEQKLAQSLRIAYSYQNFEM